MADIRIKDLTTTASSTASDDFFAADGTTNGTRKLSAYSPSFGGNATVGGTLTVNSTTTSVSGYYFGASADASLTRVAAGVIALGGAATSRIDINGATDVGIGFRQTGVRDWFVAAKSAELQTSCLSAGSIASYESGVLVRVRDTTASTSTSSGALVVGNGTSGGLGVGGSAFIGGNATVGGANVTLGTLASIPSGAYFSVETNSTEGFLTSYNGTSSVYLPINYRATEHKFTSNGVVKVQSTTASTGTSSGALVVSGGVGVAGAIYAGGNVSSAGTRGLTRYKSSNGTTASPVEDRIVGFSNTNELLFESGMYAVNSLTDNSAVWLRFKATNSSGTAATALTVDSSDVTIASGVGLKLGNAYTAGAPTATGYIVIKDSTGTSYKIPAVAL